MESLNSKNNSESFNNSQFNCPNKRNLNRNQSQYDKIFRASIQNLFKISNQQNER